MAVTRWLQLEFRLPAAAAETASLALEHAGALAVSLADPGGEPVLEPAPGAMPLWNVVVVTALLPESARSADVRAALEAALGKPVTDLRTSLVEERDWVGEFRETLQPRRYGERLWICPAGAPCPDPAGVAVTLEPGLAFGSGSHPTTAMCLDWLAGLDLRARTVLDWGCGSGVLAIAALALGARAATGLDIDPQALQATAANAGRNGCAERLHGIRPEALSADARFDVVIANILADSLIGLAPAIRRHCLAGAHVAMSGILPAQVPGVRALCAPWLELRVAAERDGWALLAGVPRPDASPA